MTECERIISEGILPESFFREEVRCDYLVTYEHKKLWAVQIDLLLKLSRVCREYGLKYFLAWGTLLGAVRHQGFIPWDDDCDVMMPREDYDKLFSLADAFEPPYFLQTPCTDSEAFFSNMRLRNSRTTGISDYFIYQGMNCGICLDISPVEKWQKNDEADYLRIRELNIKNGTYMRMKHPALDEANRRRVSEYDGTDPLSSWKEIQSIATQYRDSDTGGTVADVVGTLYPFERKIMYAEDFSESVPGKFEGFEFPIPKGYVRILETVYGEWQKYPPKHLRGGGAWKNAYQCEPPF